MAGEINFECFKNIVKAGCCIFILEVQCHASGKMMALELYSPVIESRLCHSAVVSLK